MIPLSRPEGDVAESDAGRAAAQVHTHIDAHWDDHLETVRSFLRQPSISADGTGIERMADLVAETMSQAGGSAEVLPTAGHPVVYGEIPGRSPQTVLLYGMYDVQPVAGESWDVDPFEAAVVDRPPFGACMVARGAANTKGPLAGMFNALASIRAMDGAPPLTIKLLIEGEEELGSRHLPAFVEAHHNRLRSDAGFFPMYRQDVMGKPIIHLGCKGVVFFELSARGGDQGGPTDGAVHGSRAVWFHNPAWWLLHALGSMVSPDQRRVLVEGFAEGAVGADDEDDVLLDALAQSFDPRSQLAEFGVRRFKDDLDGIPLLRRYFYEPTLNIDGLDAGHAAEGDKSMIPHLARAKFDCRLVRGMRPEVVVEAIRRHLAAHALGHLELKVHDAYPAARTSVRAPIVQALVAAYRALGYEPEIWPTIASSMPLYLFTEVLGMGMVSGGLGHGGRAHAANEYATVEGMRRFEHSLVTLLYILADRLAARGRD